jgi:S-DNA-T family DNA segregation ATPase FtsK/SpoIIIE
VAKLEEDMYNRRFAPFSKNIYFSKSEVCSLLNSKIESSPSSNIVTEYFDSKPKKPQSIHNPYSLLPEIKSTPRELDMSISKSLEKTLQGLGITKSKLKIDSFEQGATLQKLTMVIPKDTNYMKVEKQLKNIQANLGNEAISMEIGDKPSTINFYIPCDNREVIYLRSLLESEQYQEFMEEAVLPFIIGQDTVGNPLYADLQKLVHILIAGATGSGKSVFINNIITSLLLAKTPQEMIMYLIDPKQVELQVYEGIPHVKKVITDMDFAMNTLNSLVKEMEKRYSKFAEVGVRDVGGYNKKTNNPYPYIVTIVDEFADLISTHPQVESVIQRLGQKARASGIHLIIATQRPSVDVITGVVKSNLPSTFCLRLKTSVDYKTVFGKSIPYNLLGNGDGVAAIEGNHKEFERFQSPVISLIDDEVTDMLESLKEQLGSSDVEGMEICEPESNLDRLKRIIANTNENRVTHLQKEMKIRSEDVQGLMVELAEEGWVEKKGRSYVITATEDELNKWKD